MIAMAAMLINFGQWLPDLPEHINPGAIVVKNAVPYPSPATKGIAYEPARNVRTVTSGVGAPLGAATAIYANSGSLFVGTASTLYRRSGAASTMTAVGTFAAPRWRFAQFGQYMLAVGNAGEMLAYDLDAGGSFAAVAGSPTSASNVAAIRDFVVLCQPGGAKNVIHWSGINNHTSWPTVGTDAAIQVQSDRQIFPTGGDVMAVVGGLSSADMLVFQERALVRGVYLASRYVFGFDTFEGARGTRAPDSIAVVGGNAYYLARDGFYATDGVQVRPLGAQRWDRWFLSRINESLVEQVTASVDRRRKLIIWNVPATAALDGIQFSLVYSWEADAAAPIFGRDIARVTDFYSAALTVDDLHAQDAAGFADDVALPIDDPSMLGGVPLTMAITTGGAAAEYTGATLEATIDTGETVLSGTHGVAVRCNEIWPIVEASDVSAAWVYRDNQRSAPFEGQFFGIDRVGKCNAVARSRYHRARVRIPAGVEWSAAMGVHVEPIATGMVA